MQKEFLTIKEEMTAEIVEKKSKFIASVFYIEDENDANEKILKVKKENRDARHNVYAYRLSNGFEKYSDDGEPSGTAGAVILELLRGEKLSNVLIVVTRYFGGILLGTGGLARCYGGAAKLATEKLEKVQMKLCKEFKVSLSYDMYSILQYYCKNNDIKILDTKFLDKIEVKVLVYDSHSQKFLHDLSEITNRTACFELVRECYHE